MNLAGQRGQTERFDRSGAIRYSFVGQTQEEFPSHEEIVRALDGLETVSKPPGSG